MDDLLLEVDGGAHHCPSGWTISGKDYGILLHHLAGMGLGGVYSVAVSVVFL